MKKDELRSDSQAFLDVQENPSQYSDKELEELFQNEDLQEDLNCAAHLKQALLSEELAQHPAEDCDIDINAEWNHFKQKHYPQKHHQWSKIAAAIISIVLVSGFTFAAIIWQKQSVNQQDAEIAHSNHENQETTDTTNVQKTQEPKKDSVLTSSAPVLFENAELEKILEEMGRHYGKQVVFKSDVLHLRLHFEWNKELTLQQNLTVLNSFNHINISLENDKIIVE